MLKTAMKTFAALLACTAAAGAEDGSGVVIVGQQEPLHFSNTPNSTPVFTVAPKEQDYGWSNSMKAPDGTCCGGLMVHAPVKPDITITTGKTYVVITADGAIVFGPDYNPDDAARAFWQSIGKARNAACP